MSSIINPPNFIDSKLLHPRNSRLKAQLMQRLLNIQSIHRDFVLTYRRELILMLVVGLTCFLLAASTFAWLTRGIDPADKAKTEADLAEFLATSLC